MKRLSILALAAALALILAAPAAAQDNAEPEPEVSVNPYETYVVEASEDNHNGVVTANCDLDPDAGRYDVAVAGGVFSPDSDDFVVQRSFPVGSPPYGWAGSHRSVHDPDDRSALTVWAVCLKVEADPVDPQVPDDYPFDPLGIYVNQSERFEPGGQAWVRCDGSDRAVSGGVNVPFIDGSRYVLKRSFPTAGNSDDAARDGQRPDGWKVTIRSVAVGDPPGDVSAYVVCVPLATSPTVAVPATNSLALAESGSRFDMREASVRLDVSLEFATPLCDRGDVALGGGGHAVRDGERHAVRWLVPLVAEPEGYPDAWDVATRHVDNGLRPRSTEGFAICVPVIES